MKNELITQYNGRKFRKSSYSGAASCVGVAIDESGIYVVNTKQLGATVKFTASEWDAFLKGVRSGEFDLPNGEASGCDAA